MRNQKFTVLMGMLFILMANPLVFMNVSYGYVIQTSIEKNKPSDLKENMTQIKIPSKADKFNAIEKRTNKKARKVRLKESIKKWKKIIKAKLKAEKKKKKKKDGTHLIILRVLLIIIIAAVALFSLGVLAYYALFSSSNGWLIAFSIFLGLAVIFAAVIGIIWVSNNVGYY